MKIKSISNLIKLCILILFTGGVYAQPYLPGEVYYGRNQYVEYHPGEHPLIFGAPHGGDLTPDEIADRTSGVTTPDAYTKATVLAIQEASMQLTGKLPHIVISNLHRIKLDPNRDSLEAAQGNQWAEQAWREYHDFIDIAKASVSDQHISGFFVDIHGHGHDIQRLELGYLVYGSYLFKSDSLLDTKTDSSSIKALAEQSDLSLSELLRGPTSLGALFEKQGIPAVPSMTYSDPGDGNPYFSGGYSTVRHGSKYGGTINSVQIEAYKVGLRDTPENRKEYAEDIVRTFDEYFQIHLGKGLITPTDVNDKILPDELILSQNHPNPFNPSTTIPYDLPELSNVYLTVYDIQGKLIATLEQAEKSRGSYETQWNGVDQSGNQVSTGVYFARLQAGGFSQTIKMVYLR